MSRDSSSNYRDDVPMEDQCKHCGVWYQTTDLSAKMRGWVCGNCYSRYGQGAENCPKCHGRGCN